MRMIPRMLNEVQVFVGPDREDCQQSDQVHIGALRS
jgi:hypothetical protein